MDKHRVHIYAETENAVLVKTTTGEKVWVEKPKFDSSPLMLLISYAELLNCKEPFSLEGFLTIIIDKLEDWTDAEIRYAKRQGIKDIRKAHRHIRPSNFDKLVTLIEELKQCESRK